MSTVYQQQSINQEVDFNGSFTTNIEPVMYASHNTKIIIYIELHFNSFKLSVCRKICLSNDDRSIFRILSSGKFDSEQTMIFKMYI